MKNFFSHAAQTLRGALIGQIIPVIAVPVISRLYTPETYGVFASLLSISIVLTAVMFLQFEVAVVLPKEDEEAGKIARTAVQTGGFLCLALTAAACLAQPFLGQLEGLRVLQGWSILTPALAFLMATILLGNYTAARLAAYREIGMSSAWLQLINNSAMILLGFFKPGLGSLLAARFAGQASGIAAYAQAMRWVAGHFRAHGALSMGQMRAVISKYRKFPLFSLPHTLTAMLSRESVTPILIFFHQPHAAGYYALVRAILMMPVSLLSTSVGQIFYNEASRGADTPAFKAFVYRLMIAMACFFTPGCVFVALWAPEAFVIAFGKSWGEAGLFAAVFMPVALMFILTTWTGRIFEVRGRQDILFHIQLFFDVLSIASLVGMLSFTPSPIKAVAVYAACQVLYLLTYLAFVFRLMGFGARGYIGLFAAAACAGAAQAALHAAIVPLAGETSRLLAFGIELAVIAPGLLAAAYILWRRLLRGHFTDSQASPLAPDAVQP